MSYISDQDLIDRFGAKRLAELTDRSDPPTGSIVSSVLDRAVVDAAALIDGFLAARYTLPLTAIPPLVTRLAGDIVVYSLYTDRAPEKIAADYQSALKTLAQIAAGTILLDVAGLPSGQADGGQVAFDAPAHRFGRDALGRF